MTKPRLHRRFALVLLLIAGPGYGQQQAASEEQATAAEQARGEQLIRDRAALEQNVERLRGEFGVYSPNLIESYEDLAALYDELDNYEQAAATYNDALQLVRINEGLYSEQQLPLLKAMIASHEEAGNWSRVDDLNHLDFHVASRVFEPGTEPYLAAAEQYGEWKLKLIRENLLGQGSRSRLQTAEELSDFYDDILDQLAQQQGVAPAPDRTLNLLYGKTQADLLIARAVASVPYTAFTGTAQRYITQTRCRTVTNAQGQVVRECYQARVENPRYRQSQRQAKRNAISQYERQVARSIEEMQIIKDSQRVLTAAQVTQVDEQISELQTAAQQLRRNSRRPFSF